MTDDLKKGALPSVSWETLNWLNQVGFYLFSLYFFLQETRKGALPGNGWYFFMVSTLFIAISSVNSSLFKRFTNFLTLVLMVLDIFILPFSLRAYGCSVELAALTGVLYVLVSVVVSPLLVGLTVLIGGVLFAVFQKSCYVGLGMRPAEDMAKIAAAYIALAVLGYCWRLLIQKLHALYRLAYGGAYGPGGAEEQQERIAKLEADNQLLKKEVATHIVELDNMLGENK